MKILLTETRKPAKFVRAKAENGNPVFSFIIYHSQFKFPHFYTFSHFHKVRFYGLYSNKYRGQHKEIIRELNPKAQGSTSLMKLIADENIDHQIVDKLRQDGHEIFYVLEMKPSISDDEVIQLANFQP